MGEDVFWLALGLVLVLLLWLALRRGEAEAAERLSDRGYGYVQLSQLAVEHLLGAR